jgi:pimeloyl-ACP methyl ester carboxylesterase
MSTIKPVIYCIPGTGVDHRVFSQLDFGEHEVRYIQWVLPHKKETMEAYALRLSEQIDASKPFVLVGLSLGGMLCASLTEHLNPVLVIIISSSKSSVELPFTIRILHAIPFYRLFSDSAFIRLASLSRRIFGFRGKADAQLFLEMLKTAPKGFYSRAVDIVAGWKDKTTKHGIVHIHGTHDKVIPASVVKADYLIQGGSHNMLRTHSAEISVIIQKELKKIAT